MKAPKLSEYISGFKPAKGETVYLEKGKILNKIITYTNFLTQPLELWMFVPSKLVNGKWEVLEEPINYDSWERLHYNNGGEKGTIGFKKHEEYQQALDKVIFKGCKTHRIYNDLLLDDLSITDEKELVNFMWYSPITKDWQPSKGLKTIEDIIHLVELTDKKAKELNLC